MARPQLKISIPKPCSENWNAMTPQAKGRFCASCATTVVDFGQFTDKQLLEFFAKSSGKTCGRFSASQLNRPVYAETIPKQNFFPRLVTAAALFLGISSQTQAQIYHSHPVPTGQAVEQKSSEETPAKTVGKTPEKVSGEGSVIEGRVIDETTREGLIGVTVAIQGTGIGTTTDVNGDYKITIPDFLQTEKILIVTHYIGYNDVANEIERNKLPLQQNFELNLNENMLSGEIVITQIKKTPGYYLRSFWWKTKNFFRKND